MAYTAKCVICEKVENVRKDFEADFLYEEESAWIGCQVCQNDNEIAHKVCAKTGKTKGSHWHCDDCEELMIQASIPCDLCV